MPEPTHENAFSSNIAENYERYFVPVIGRPLAADLIEAAGLHPGERVLDIACGTGIVTRLAAERVGPDGTIAGLDVNPAMLAVAREATSTGAPVVWHESPAEALPLSDEAFDAVLCGMGLQFFSDKQTVLQEVQRVLVRGGRFVASLPGPMPAVLEAMGEVLARHVSPESASFVQLVFSLHDADELQNLAMGAGFGNVSVRAAAKTLQVPPPEDFLWQYVHSTPLAAAMSQLDEDRHVALSRDFTTMCQGFVEDNALTLQVNLTTLTATK